MKRSRFDPQTLGMLEVGWWIAHNEGDKAELFKLLTEQTIELYGIPKTKAEEALESLAQGINYHDSREWKKATEKAVEYYSIIKDESELNFNPDEVGSLEVGWWRLHDKLEGDEDKTPLAGAFANLYSKIFGTDEEKLLHAGSLRARATFEHDLAEADGVSQDDSSQHWTNAKELLIQFYTELQRAVDQESQ